MDVMRSGVVRTPHDGFSNHAGGEVGAPVRKNAPTCGFGATPTKLTTLWIW